MIDIKATREAYDLHEISSIGWIRTKYIVADGLRKLGRCEVLQKVIDSRSMTVNLVQ